jgi:hypothetical protein
MKINSGLLFLFPVFVIKPIHNVQALVPVENLLAMYETVQEFGKY